ncbi:M23 family metallopeptidase [Pseudonocardia sp. RS11V-5]|uniref:M23 family metallopeptidase n=1 Tax=Pseudonocardia terrae TaxID=2905831 RepID=UPI001E4E3BFD|nr:M23 family metallopeptidase [Pseudonocardia terrae]MCE3554279.1 M23 family metallopeptidase [Pseudonocardia terrae]
MRATVAACAGGALVAAGQTLLTALAGPAVAADPYERLAANAMLPVADEVASAPASTAPATASAQPIGADQLTGSSPQALPVLDEKSELDVASLTKAVDIGTKIAATAKQINAALSAGAPQAVLEHGEAYVLPTTGRFTSGFGARWGVTHYGIDLAAPIGTPIFAFTDGVVEESGPASGFGMWVVLRHPDGTHTVYGHINRSLVTVGQTVSAGEEIAEVGNRGQSTGPHLHFEIWDAAKNKINPLPILQAMGLRVVGDGANSPD